MSWTTPSGATAASGQQETDVALSEGDVDGPLGQPNVEGVGIGCFEWPHRHERQPHRSFGWRRRISIVCLIRRNNAHVVHDTPSWDWELIDLRHGGTYEIGRMSFFWFMPIEEFSAW